MFDEFERLKTENERLMEQLEKSEVKRGKRSEPVPA